MLYIENEIGIWELAMVTKDLNKILELAEDYRKQGFNVMIEA